MLHILLVDDDEDEHLFFQWSLEKIGADIKLSCVFSTTQAIAVLRETVPAVIFVDINLPGADGLDCLASIRKMRHLKAVPVYMYSTDISEGTLCKAALLGANGCIKKSRNHELLAKMIRENVTLPYF
jgi:CheY-like chemotaxis protein